MPLHELNSDLETVTLNCAEALAEYVHFGQVDKQGQPYIQHVMRVAKACRNLSLDQRVAAILHDAVEDRPDKINLEMIGELFNDGVADLVEILSHRPKPIGETNSQYIERIAFEPLAIPIKLADLADNLDPARGPIPDSLREKYEKAVQKLLAVYMEKAVDEMVGPEVVLSPEDVKRDA